MVVLGELECTLIYSKLYGDKISEKQNNKSLFLLKILKDCDIENNTN